MITRPIFRLLQLPGPPEPLPYYDSLLPFNLLFWELDEFVDDLLADFCWKDEFNNCKPVPKNILHDGYYYGSFNSSYISITFIPVPL